jgi:hypothetical protein
MHCSFLQILLWMDYVNFILFLSILVVELFCYDLILVKDQIILTFYKKIRLKEKTPK